MSTATSTATINASLDAASEAVSNVGRVEGWHPQVKRSPVLSPEPTGMGAQRRCDFYDGTSVVETVTALKDREMVQVELSEFDMPFRQASIVIRLQELAPKPVHARLEFDFDVMDGIDVESLKPTMDQTFAHILAGWTVTWSRGSGSTTPASRVPQADTRRGPRDPRCPTLASRGAEAVKGRVAEGTRPSAQPTRSSSDAHLRSRAAAFSPIIIAGALVFPPLMVGMMDTSATYRLSNPRTLSESGSTTVPREQVPTGW